MPVRWLFIWLCLLGSPRAGAQDTNLFTPYDAGSHDILILDVGRVRANALAYQSIQLETERVRDLLNALYQEHLANLQARRNALIEQETNLNAETYNVEIAGLEQRAIELEGNRQQNFATVERRRQEALNIADIQLNAVMAGLLKETGARYVLNQQSALVWPDIVNVTEEAIARLNQLLPSVGFTIEVREEGQEAAIAADPAQENAAGE